MNLTQKQKGIVALIILAWVFASMGVFARYLGTAFELFEQTYLRIGLAFLFGSILFAPWVRWRIFCQIGTRDMLLILARAITLYLGIVLFTQAILETSLSNASLIAALPLLPLFGYIMLGERVTRRVLLWIGVGFVGVLMITFQPNESVMRIGYGEFLALLSLLAFDFSYVARRWQTKTLNNYETTLAMFFVGALFLFITSVFIGESLPTSDQFTVGIFVTLVIAALFNVINLILTSYSLEHVPVAIVGNILTLEVVFALLYGFFLYNELPSLTEFLGGGLVLASVIIINKIES